jgi:hypothetical protein
MTREDIAAVMGRVSGLNSFGIGCFDPRSKTPAERDREIAAGRAELLDDVDGCSRAEGWLRGKARTKTIDPHRSSYDLEHLAEEEVGYITNGAFIVAAIHLGFPYRIYPDSANPRFGISRRSLSTATTRIRPDDPNHATGLIKDRE